MGLIVLLLVVVVAAVVFLAFLKAKGQGGIGDGKFIASGEKSFRFFGGRFGRIGAGQLRPA